MLRSLWKRGLALLMTFTLVVGFAMPVFAEDTSGSGTDSTDAIRATTETAGDSTSGSESGGAGEAATQSVPVNGDSTGTKNDTTSEAASSTSGGNNTNMPPASVAITGWKALAASIAAQTVVVDGEDPVAGMPTTLEATFENGSTQSFAVTWAPNTAFNSSAIDNEFIYTATVTSALSGFGWDAAALPLPTIKVTVVQAALIAAGMGVFGSTELANIITLSDPKVFIGASTTPVGNNEVITITQDTALTVKYTWAFNDAQYPTESIAPGSYTTMGTLPANLPVYDLAVIAPIPVKTSTTIIGHITFARNLSTDPWNVILTFTDGIRNLRTVNGDLIIESTIKFQEIINKGDPTDVHFNNNLVIQIGEQFPTDPSITKHFRYATKGGTIVANNTFDTMTWDIHVNTNGAIMADATIIDTIRSTEEGKYKYHSFAGVAANDIIVQRMDREGNLVGSKLPHAAASGDVNKDPTTWFANNAYVTVDDDFKATIFLGNDVKGAYRITIPTKPVVQLSQMNGNTVRFINRSEINGKNEEAAYETIYPKVLTKTGSIIKAAGVLPGGEDLYYAEWTVVVNPDSLPLTGTDYVLEDILNANSYYPMSAGMLTNLPGINLPSYHSTSAPASVTPDLINGDKARKIIFEFSDLNNKSVTITLRSVLTNKQVWEVGDQVRNTATLYRRSNMSDSLYVEKNLSWNKGASDENNVGLWGDKYDDGAIDYVSRTMGWKFLCLPRMRPLQIFLLMTTLSKVEVLCRTALRPPILWAKIWVVCVCLQGNQA